MRDKLTTAAEALGATSITVGAGLAWLPAGLMIGGALLIAGSYLAGAK